MGQPSAAEVLILISDWSGLKFDDVIWVTTPNKEVTVGKHCSAKAGNLFLVTLGDYDVALGTKKRLRPLDSYQT